MCLLNLLFLFFLLPLLFTTDRYIGVFLGALTLPNYPFYINLLHIRDQPYSTYAYLDLNKLGVLCPTLNAASGEWCAAFYSEGAEISSNWCYLS